MLSIARAGRGADALRVLDLAVDLAPDDGELIARREAILSTPSAPTPASGATEAPDDLESARRLDRALSARGDHGAPLAMWSADLARHPNEGRAFLERGGAHAQLGHGQEALADALRACELDLSEACSRARTFAARR